MNITILGAGAYGSVLGTILTTNHHTVTFYDPIKYPDLTLAAATHSADVIIFVAPSHTAPDLLPQLSTTTPLICASKGFLSLTPFQSFTDFSILSGAAFAADLNAQTPTTLTATSSLVSDLFTTPWLSFEQTDDLLGVLLCGSFKNVYAIGSGLRHLTPDSPDFIPYIDACLEELRSVLTANHASPETAQLSCGLGDLILTCSSTESRNYRFGLALSDASTSTSTPNITPTETTEGLSVIHAIINNPDFTMPKDAPILSQIIDKSTQSAKE